jgi:hypothetical protein
MRPIQTGNQGISYPYVPVVGDYGRVGAAGPAGALDYSPDEGILLAPTGTIAQTVPRNSAVSQAGQIIVGGTITGALIALREGQKITNINYMNGGTGGATLTHHWAVLADANGIILAASADDVAATIPTTTQKTYPLTAPYTVPFTGAYYVATCVVGTTMPTPLGVTTGAGTAAHALAPVTYGTFNTGQVAGPLAVGVKMTAITVAVGQIYFWLT